MTVYSGSLKNLVSGISQQPPLLRLPEQLAEQLNGYSSETSGLQKRPPTVYVNTLMDSIDETAEPLVHFVNRDEYERYIMYFYNGGLRIFDLEGNEKTVTIKEDADYIATDQPRKDIRCITVADYTFIVNKTKQVAMSDELSPNAFETQGCLIHVKSGQYGRTYQILLDGEVIASYETPDGGDASHTKKIDTNNIVNELNTSLQGITETQTTPLYETEVGSSWLLIKNVDSSKITTKDGYNNNAMIAVGTAVQKFSLLPASAPDGYTVRIKNSDGDEADNAGEYYVHYNADDKVWEECVAPNLLISFDASTMPHTLIRQSDGTFTFQRAEWVDRECGDDDSNPLPSFVDHTLNDIFFYRNRLGLLSGENVILSESAEYFNWWMTTANDILDTDCIDIPTTTSRINILNYAVPFNESLYLFSNSTQFRLSTDTTLSPKNVALVEVTNFESSDTCRPVVAGKNMYFPVERAEFTTVREYYNVQQVSDVKNAQDITSHVPSYIPNGVYEILSQNNENIMLFLTEGDENCIYVYKYLWTNDTRVQASWSKWDLHGHIFGAFFVNSDLYIVLNHGGKHLLEKLTFTYQTKDFDAHELYRVYLDTKKVATTGVYDADFETTTFNLKEEWNLDDLSDLSHVGLVAKNGDYFLLEVTGDTVTVDGDYTQQDVILGVPYTFKAVFSPIYMRSVNPQGDTRAYTNGRMQIRELRLNYADTGAFDVFVRTRSATKNYSYRLTAKKIHQYLLGDYTVATGEFRVPVQSINTGYTAWVQSDMPLPVNLIGCLWYGTFVARSTHRG